MSRRWRGLRTVRLSSGPKPLCCKTLSDIIELALPPTDWLKRTHLSRVVNSAKFGSCFEPWQWGEGWIKKDCTIAWRLRRERSVERHWCVKPLWFGCTELCFLYKSAVGHTVKLPVDVSITGNSNILGKTDEAGNLNREVGKPHVLNVERCHVSCPWDFNNGYMLYNN
jgi:hypothetical protein